MCVCMTLCKSTDLPDIFKCGFGSAVAKKCVCVYIYIYVCVCMYTYMCVYICVYVYMIHCKFAQHGLVRFGICR